MRRIRPSHVLLGLLVALYALELWRGASELPERVATHFDLAGRPDGYGSRGSLLTALACMGVVSCGLGFGLPALLARLPDELVNVPARDYWLAPERRAATRDRIAEQMRWISIWTAGFMLAIAHEAIELNRAAAGGHERAALPIGWALGIYLAGTLAFVGSWIVRFRRPA